MYSSLFTFCFFNNEKNNMHDSKYMSANEKMQVLKAWKRFIKGGCKYTQFTKALYNHLIQHCSFIAHYNRAGFYTTYFGSEDDKSFFFRQFDRDFGCQSIEYGDVYWIRNGNDVCQQCYDINNAMVDAYMEMKNEVAA